jgi:hypothetical protein
MKSALKALGLWLWDKKVYWMPAVGGFVAGAWLL